jgi:predicted P-loop ATPase
LKQTAHDPAVKLKYDKEISIATAPGRQSKKWRNKLISISQFLNTLTQPIRTDETIDEYFKMGKGQQDEIKDVGAFVGAALKGGRRRKVDVANRTVITLDLDYATPQTLDQIKKKIKSCYTVYSTHKHTPAHPRFRLLVWPDRVMLPDEYQAVARKIAEAVGIEWFDDTSYDINRLFYYPSAAIDAEYVYYHNDTPFLDVDKVLKSYGKKNAWKDVSLWPRSSRETKTFDRLLKKQADPLTKKGVVGAFCRVVDIHTALQKYLSDTYRQESRDRYTFIDGTSTNGLIIYNSRYCYSNHASDPACGQLCNAFDIIRIHKFGYKDAGKIKSDTPVTRVPSYVEMMEWCRGIDAVKIELIKSKIDLSPSDFDVFNTDADDNKNADWQIKLQITAAGDIKPSFLNAVLIMENDPQLNKLSRWNKFSMRMENRADNTDWTKENSLNVRAYIGSVYGPDFPERKIEDAIEKNAFRNKYHPVRDYLKGLEWDGVERIAKLFVTYFGCEDNAYTREISTCWFTAAVARIFNPGYKFDTAIVISGAQGIGKTTFIKTLGLGKWYGELSSFDQKIAIEEISGKWIVEISEMGATNRQELEQQKTFLSAKSTRVRLAYERLAVDYKRQCVFIGSTNLETYLKDSSGNRRWWPLKAQTTKVDIKTLEKEVNQIWAEAFSLWAQGQTTVLSEDALQTASYEQEDKMETDPWKGIIGSWLEEKAYVDRYDSDEQFDSGELETRTKVCVIEVWKDCLKMNGYPRRIDCLRIGRNLTIQKDWEKYGNTMQFGKRFGTQKAWIKSQSDPSFFSNQSSFS